MISPHLPYLLLVGPLVLRNHQDCIKTTTCLTKSCILPWSLVLHQVLDRYPLSHFLSYSLFSSAHCSFLANITSHTKPTSYAQAILDPLWQQAMHAELDTLQHKNTWSMVPLPDGHKLIWCKWVYKIKYKSDDTIERYKYRLVAKGYIYSGWGCLLSRDLFTHNQAYYSSLPPHCCCFP